MLCTSVSRFQDLLWSIVDQSLWTLLRDASWALESTYRSSANEASSIVSESAVVRLLQNGRIVGELFLLVEISPSTFQLLSVPSGVQVQTNLPPEHQHHRQP